MNKCYHIISLLPVYKQYIKPCPGYIKPDMLVGLELYYVHLSAFIRNRWKLFFLISIFEPKTPDWKFSFWDWKLLFANRKYKFLVDVVKYLNP